MTPIPQEATVTLAMQHVDGLTGMSVSEVKGFGRGRAKDSPHAVREDLVDYIPHVKIEIVCHDELVDDVVETIRRAAHTSLRGVSHVEEAVRISAGERGEAAVSIHFDNTHANAFLLRARRAGRDRGVLHLLDVVAARPLGVVARPRHGRAFAAYGGVYITASLGWLWAVEGVRPDRWDVLGVALCLLGAAVILLAPRPVPSIP